MARGIDVSNVNGPIEWKLVRLAGFQFAFLKATEGKTFNDPYFAQNRAQAELAGVRIGPYHFARPDHNDPITEARHFAEVVGKLKAGELRPVLDYEIPTSLTTSHTLQWITTFNQEVKRLTGVLPIFYSYPALIAGMSLSRPVGAGLWEAAYGPNDGQPHTFMVPRPWRRAVLHQFTSKGKVPGVNGAVDISEGASLRPLLAHPVRAVVHRVSPWKHKPLP